MEAEYIKRNRYGLRFHACSFFLLALLVRLSGPSIRSFRSYSPRSDTENRGQLYTHCGGQHGPYLVGHRGVGRRGAGHTECAGCRGAGYRGGAGHIGDGHGGAGYRGASHGGADHRGAGHGGAGYIGAGHRGACYGGAGQNSGGLDSGAETTVEELAKTTMGEYS